MLPETEMWRVARKRAEDKAGFVVHLSMYVIVNSFLVFLWWSTSGGTAFPWFVFPLFGWGIGIVAHFMGAFLGTGITDRMARREFERMRQHPPRA